MGRLFLIGAMLPTSRDNVVRQLHGNVRHTLLKMRC